MLNNEKIFPRDNCLHSFYGQTLVGQMCHDINVSVLKLYLIPKQLSDGSFISNTPVFIFIYSVI